MIDGAIVPFLSLFTLLAVAVLALISKERTRDRMRDPDAPVSTLAKDGKYGGVAFLLPLEVRARRVEMLRRRVVPLI
ncbi:MAG: hypothetical protein ACK40I_04630 [Tabrizicola sp.]